MNLKQKFPRPGDEWVIPQLHIDMGYLASAAYSDETKPAVLQSTPHQERPAGVWERILSNNQESVGLSGAVYVDRSGQFPPVAVARGTEGLDLRDNKANIGQGSGLSHTAQYRKHIAWIKRISSMPQFENLHLSGHSLGGGLQGAASAETGLPAVTFNAAGVHPHTVKNIYNTNQINYFASTDPLNGAQNLFQDQIVHAIHDKNKLAILLVL